MGSLFKKKKMQPVIEIFQLIHYVGGGSRPFQERNRILNSIHILLCRLTHSDANVKKYFALCLQTSSLNTYPP